MLQKNLIKEVSGDFLLKSTRRYERFLCCKNVFYVNPRTEHDQKFAFDYKILHCQHFLRVFLIKRWINMFSTFQNRKKNIFTYKWLFFQSIQNQEKEYIRIHAESFKDNPDTIYMNLQHFVLFIVLKCLCKHSFNEETKMSWHLNII